MDTSAYSSSGFVPLVEIPVAVAAVLFTLLLLLVLMGEDVFSAAGAAAAATLAPERVRARFDGGRLAASRECEEPSIDDVFFLCLLLLLLLLLPFDKFPAVVLLPVDCGPADSSPSSADASRDEGCRRSVVEDFGITVE